MTREKKIRFEPNIDMTQVENAINNMLRQAWENKSFRERDKPVFFTLSVKIEPNGKMMVDKFSNIPQAIRKKPTLEKKKVLVDLCESEEDFTITMELPFIKEDNLKIRLFENKIVITSLKPSSFYKQVILEQKIVIRKTIVNFKNNILEIIAPKAKD